MGERPILFSGAMVKAILEGRKTQTRRVINPQPERDPMPCHYVRSGWALSDPWEHGVACTCREIRFPYAAHKSDGGPDRLWVRETFCFPVYAAGEPTAITYRADEVEPRPKNGPNWKPSIFMPRKWSRITLEIITIRPERLHEITVDDIRAEGIQLAPTELYPDINAGTKLKRNWQQGWDKINGKRKGCSWSDNPWVWVIEFQRVTARAQEVE